MAQLCLLDNPRSAELILYASTDDLDWSSITVLRNGKLFTLASEAEDYIDSHLLVGDLPEGDYEVLFFNDYRWNRDKEPYGRVAFTFSVRAQENQELEARELKRSDPSKTILRTQESWYQAHLLLSYLRDSQGSGPCREARLYPSLDDSDDLVQLCLFKDLQTDGLVIRAAHIREYANAFGWSSVTVLRDGELFSLAS